MKMWIAILCASFILLPGAIGFAGDEGAPPAEGAGDPPAEEKPVDRKALQKELRTISGELNKVTRTLAPLLLKIDEDPDVAQLKKAYEDKVKEKLAVEGEDKAGLLDKRNELEKKKAELSKQLWKPRTPKKKPAGDKKPKAKKPKAEKKPKPKKDDGGGDAGGGDAGGGDAGGGGGDGWGDGW